jgi:hypothetical protein
LIITSSLWLDDYMYACNLDAIRGEGHA